MSILSARHLRESRDTTAARVVREAAHRLASRRVAQGGRPTFGDEADAAFLAALRGLGPADVEVATDIGRDIGQRVYARRYLDAEPPAALAELAGLVAASGLATVHVEHWFHREGVLLVEPARVSDAPIVTGFVAGAVEVFLAATFNCEVRVKVLEEGRLAARLLHGRSIAGGGGS